MTSAALVRKNSKQKDAVLRIYATPRHYILAVRRGKTEKSEGERE